MTSKPALRRLIDLPGIADLELKALMKRDFAEPEARAEHPEIDECATALFGLTADEAEAVERPAGWDNIETKPPSAQVFAFEDAGWDVTDDKRRALRVLVEGDARLFNQYGVMAVSPQRHPHVQAAAAQRFIDWILSPAGQAAIADYRINGEQLFFPNAAQPEPVS